jgi:Bacterial membrane protein YfhO
VLVPGDALIYSFPLKLLAARMMQAGHWPLWNPYVFSGFPLFGQMQLGHLYPGSWLLIVLPPALAINLLMLSTYSVATLGAYAYARAIGCTRLASAFAGLSFGFSGFMVSHIGHTSTVHAVACLPWFLLALERLRHRAAWRYVVGGAVALLLCLVSGHPPVPMYLLMAGGAYVLWFGVVVRPPIGRLRYVGMAAAAVVLAQPLAAVQLLPAIELARQSVRAHLTFEQFTSFSLPVRQLPSLLFPALFGGNWGVPYWGAWGGPWEITGYIGVAPVMLAAAALTRFTRDRMIRFWVLIAAAALWITLGSATPLAHLLFHIPVYNLFRAPGRHVLFLDFALATLSALTLTRILPAAPRNVRMAAVGVLALVLASAWITVTWGRAIWGELAARAVASGFDNPALSTVLSWSNLAILYPVLLAGIAAGLLWWCAMRPSLWSIGSLLALQAVDLFLFVGWAPSIFPRRDALLQPPEIVRTLNALEPDPSQYRLALATAGSYRTVSTEYAIWDIPLVNGYDPFLTARYGQVAGGMDYAGVIPDQAFRREPGFLDLLNGKYLYASIVRDDPSSIPGGLLRFAFQTMDIPVPPSQSVTFHFPDPVRTSRIGVVSTLTNGAAVPDGAHVARVAITDRDGRNMAIPLRTGVETAEWDWDRVRPLHHQAPVFETVPLDGSTGYRYRGISENFGIRWVTDIRIEQLGGPATIHVSRVTLFDGLSNSSMFATDLHRLFDDPDRWELIAAERDSMLLKNRKAMPRAWLVPTLTRVESGAAATTIRRSRFPDGRPFDPRATALIEDGGDERLGAPDADARASIVRYEPNRVDVQTETRAPALLVLADAYYPGWEATVDGVPTDVQRVDAVLRGVRVPDGTHTVSFAFRPRSVWIGLLISLTTALALIVAAVWIKMRTTDEH